MKFLCRWFRHDWSIWLYLTEIHLRDCRRCCAIQSVDVSTGETVIHLASMAVTE